MIIQHIPFPGVHTTLLGEVPRGLAVTGSASISSVSPVYRILATSFPPVDCKVAFISTVTTWCNKLAGHGDFQGAV